MIKIYLWYSPWVKFSKLTVLLSKTDFLSTLPLESISFLLSPKVTTSVTVLMARDAHQRLSYSTFFPVSVNCLVAYQLDVKLWSTAPKNQKNRNKQITQAYTSNHKKGKKNPTVKSWNYLYWCKFCDKIFLPILKSSTATSFLVTVSLLHKGIWLFKGYLVELQALSSN